MIFVGFIFFVWAKKYVSVKWNVENDLPNWNYSKAFLLLRNKNILGASLSSVWFETRARLRSHVFLAFLCLTLLLVICSDNCWSYRGAICIIRSLWYAFVRVCVNSDVGSSDIHFGNTTCETVVRCRWSPDCIKLTSLFQICPADQALSHQEICGLQVSYDRGSLVTGIYQK